MILFRYFFSLKGRMSANRYRKFLLIYFIGVLPLFSSLYFALMMIGFRGSGRLFEKTDLVGWIIASIVYFVGCMWPLIVATARRLQDLGYHWLQHFLILSPTKTWILGRELLYKPGVDKENTYGANPGEFERD